MKKKTRQNILTLEHLTFKENRENKSVAPASTEH